MPQARELGRRPELDGVRGIAVLCVIMAHAYVIAPAVIDTPIVSRLAASGFLGVDTFFVLSGFLITALLLTERERTGSVRLGAFFLRRALRLLPPLYFMLAAVWVHGLITDFRASTGQFTQRTIVAALTYTSNFFAKGHPEMVGDLGHLWSLAIEEQFYLVWPFLLLALLGWTATRHSVTPIVLALAAVVVIHRTWVFDHHGWYPAYLGTLTRSDGLFVGAAAAMLWHGRAFGPKVLRYAGATGSAVALAGLLVLRGDSALTYRGGLFVFNVAVASILLSLVDSEWMGRRFLSWQPLAGLGRVSYGVYLWHPVVFWMTRRSLISARGWVQVGVALGLTAATVTLSWWVIERPSRSLRIWATAKA